MTAALLIRTATDSDAQNQNTATGNRLLGPCRDYANDQVKPVEQQLAGFCAGTVDALMPVGRLFAPGTGFCIPNGVTRGQLVRVLVGFIERNPQRLHER